MIEIAVEGAKVRCSHGMGYAKPVSSRPFLTIKGRAVLVDRDLPGNKIRLCPNVGPTTKPCTRTLPLAKGWSTFVFANGAPVALVKAKGPTDGIPPGVTYYSIRTPGQDLVRTSG